MRLSVNVDHVATVRQARGGKEPDPVAAAILAEIAGADGIIVHLREDRRHIQERDLRLLRDVVKTHLNLEMAAVEEMVQMARDVKPDMVTLVPERREELTTEGGLDVVGGEEILSDVVKTLHGEGMLVSLFIDPEIEQIKSAAGVGADYVELHTGSYAEAANMAEEMQELSRLEKMAAVAHKTGLGVSAGHGLNYRNVSNVVHIEVIEELNIGYSIVSRALLVGFQQAVREMKELVKSSLRSRMS